MSDRVPESIELPAVVPFLLNALLAGIMGFYVSGWIGVGIAITLLSGVFAIFWLAGYLRRKRDNLVRLRVLIWRIVRPLVGILALPLVLLLAIPAVLVSWLLTKLEALPRAPALSLTEPLADAGRRTLLFFSGFFRPSNLPGTAANLLLLLILLCVAVGIEVAFYVALAAVPIMLLTFAMVAVEFSREPDED